MIPIHSITEASHLRARSRGSRITTLLVSVAIVIGLSIPVATAAQAAEEVDPASVSAVAAGEPVVDSPEDTSESAAPTPEPEAAPEAAGSGEAVGEEDEKAPTEPAAGAETAEQGDARPAPVVAFAGFVVDSPNVNDTPVAVLDAYTKTRGIDLVVAAPGVLGNDEDADGDALTASFIYTGPDITVALQPDGSFTVHQNVDTANVTYWFSYKVCDPQGACAIAEAMIGVKNNTGHEPTTGSDVYQTEVGTALHVDAPGVLANDSDPDGDLLTVKLSPQQTKHGSIVMNGTSGGFDYVPAAGYIGPDVFLYWLTDGSNWIYGSVHIDVVPLGTPDDPADPVDPVDPADPADPADQVGPAEAAGPAEAVDDPAETGSPAGSVLAAAESQQLASTGSESLLIALLALVLLLGGGALLIIQLARRRS